MKLEIQRGETVKEGKQSFIGHTMAIRTVQDLCTPIAGISYVDLDCLEKISTTTKISVTMMNIMQVLSC